VPTVPTAPDPVKVAAEERRRLRLELEKQKLQWRQNKDIAKAIGWFLDRMSEDGEGEDDDNWSSPNALLETLGPCILEPRCCTG